MEKICVAVRVRPPVSDDVSFNGTFWNVDDNRISLHKSTGTPLSGVSFTFGFYTFLLFLFFYLLLICWIVLDFRFFILQIMCLINLALILGFMTFLLRTLFMLLLKDLTVLFFESSFSWLCFDLGFCFAAFLKMYMKSRNKMNWNQNIKLARIRNTIC